MGLMRCGGAFIGVVTRFPEHGSRALHARDRRDGGNGVQPFLEALGLVFALLGCLQTLAGWAIVQRLLRVISSGEPTIIAVVSLLVIGSR
jgi:hypothetical protein